MSDKNANQRLGKGLAALIGEPRPQASLQTTKL